MSEEAMWWKWRVRLLETAEKNLFSLRFAYIDASEGIKSLDSSAITQNTGRCKASAASLQEKMFLSKAAGTYREG